MRLAALVPFKCFTRAKRRLRGHYADSEVEELGRAMLTDVLSALSLASGLECVRVLTDDPAVADVAHATGAEVRMRTPDPGLNPALEAATSELVEAGFEGALVVLGDLPLLRARDVEQVIRSDPARALVIVPSTDGGTAMLLRRPPDCIPPLFGPQSARRHRERGESRGLRPLELPELGDSLLLDLDTPEDALRLLESGQACRTRTLLQKLHA